MLFYQHSVHRKCRDIDATWTGCQKKKAGKKKMQRNLSGCRYIGIIVMLFYICWLPYVTLSLIANICLSCIKSPITLTLSETFLALGFLNSALNPFFYPFHDKRFKEAFRDIWKKLRSKSFLKVLHRKEKVLEVARLEIVVRGQWLAERFLIECCKIKTKVIGLLSQEAFKMA